MGVDPIFVRWIYNYLTDRLQYVKLGTSVSQTLVSNTGAPQGTVLSPFLFTIYTADHTYSSTACHIQKYSDDTAVVACVKGGDEWEYRGVISSFTEWSRSNGLILNTAKTKEMIIDFSRKPSHQPITIDGETIEVVKTYKYLGVHLDNKLDWSVQANALYKKGQSRLHFLRRLRAFDVSRDMLYIFYQSVVAGAVFFGVVCWGGSMTLRDRNRLDKLIGRCVSVMGRRVDSVGEVLERRMRTLMQGILSNTRHPLHQCLSAQKSNRSDSLLSLRCRTEQFKKSFVPAALRLYNS